MKFLWAILTVVLLLAGSRAGFSQGFMNLNFEQAKIIPATDSPYYPYGITTSNALPGWTALIGGVQQSEITYNDPSTGATWITLFATNGEQIDGNFSVSLQGGLSASAASISQTGLVPIGTESILFEAQLLSSGAPLSSLVLSLGGQNIPFSTISTGSNSTLYGGNIPSAFAGQSEQLTISALEGLGNSWNIDDIQFSTSSVPEPGELALAALGGLCFVWRRWRKQ